jgi:hypothetical protein
MIGPNSSVSAGNEAYSIGTNSWASRTGAPTITNCGAATGNDGRIYFFGADATFFNGIAQAYDVTSDNWTSVAAMPTSRNDLGVVAGPDGRIYAIAGNRNTSSYLTTVEAYTPSTNTWVTTPSLQTGRIFFATSVGPDGRLYVLGGAAYGTTTRLSSVEVYGPVMSFSPKTGPKATLVAVTGSNFAATATVSVYWGATTGMLLGTGSTDASGALVSPINFTVPQVAPAAYKVTVVDNKSQYPIGVTFTVTP